jgi:hypothetical protein
MKRPVGVTLTAVVQVLGSLLVLIGSVLMLFMPALMRGTPRPTPPSPIESLILYGAAAVYGFFALSGFLTAIGVFRLKNWARYSTLVFAGFVVVMGLLLALEFVLMPVPGMPSRAGADSPAAITPMLRLLMAAFPLGFALLGAAWLYYFNRASIRSVFIQSDKRTNADAKGILVGGRRVPLSILVIAAFSLFGAIVLIPFAFWLPANIFFGFIVTGYACKVITLLLGALDVYVGIALLRLSEMGRRVAIAANFVYLANTVVFWFVPNRVHQYFELYGQMVGAPASSAMAPYTTVTYMRYGVLLGVAEIGVNLYFLVTRAGAFRAESAQFTSFAQ